VRGVQVGPLNSVTDRKSDPSAALTLRFAKSSSSLAIELAAATTGHERRRQAPAFVSSQRLRTVSVVPHWGQALQVPVSRGAAAMHCCPDWREEQGLRPL